ncbi:MAG: transcriptional repressor LexA [Candidatus Dojkabacteria bacterium]|nr:transcriptional repressor LexA [Candidatus Dojkabacteria bacterium]
MDPIGQKIINAIPVLYPRQRKVLRFIEEHIAQHGYAPTLTKIKDFLGVRALSTVHEHLIKLEEKGYLERCDDDKSIRLKLKQGVFAGTMINVPLVGTITAGQPIDAFEEPEQMEVPLPSNLVGNKKVFALKVRGDSMIESLIADNDIVICEKVDFARNGDTVVALLDDNTATLKKFYKERTCIRLQPANPRYQPIRVKSITIQGKVIAIYRKYEN